MGLMCETLLGTALRREELCSWRVDTLPLHKADWRIGDQTAPYGEQRVLVEIRYGTKGPDYAHDCGDKIGPQRSIWIPLSLADSLHAYRLQDRNIALRRWIQRAARMGLQKRDDNVVHLFLDENTGERISAKRLYRAWTGVRLPMEGWSPHLGRHWWACSTLWAQLMRHERLWKLGEASTEELIHTSATNVIRLQIQPQLGHADERTSMRYLDWALDMFQSSLRSG
jgi:integrase